MNTLPDELVAPILSFLPYSDVIIVKAVNRRLADAAGSLEQVAYETDMALRTEAYMYRGYVCAACAHRPHFSLDCGV